MPKRRPNLKQSILCFVILVIFCGHYSALFPEGFRRSCISQLVAPQLGDCVKTEASLTEMTTLDQLKTAQSVPTSTATPAPGAEAINEAYFDARESAQDAVFKALLCGIMLVEQRDSSGARLPLGLA